MLLRSKHIFLTAILLLFAPLYRGSLAIGHDDIAPQNPQVIRKLLISAINSGKVTDSLYQKLTAIRNPTGLVNGYIGTLQALKAKHTWNPYYKLKYLNEAEKTFTKAVTSDTHNIEIRFMRFSVEHNVPGFLGYTKNLVADREEIIKQIERKHYSSADEPLVKTIVNFLLDSKRCTPAEQNKLSQHLAAL